MIRTGHESLPVWGSLIHGEHSSSCIALCARIFPEQRRLWGRSITSGMVTCSDVLPGDFLIRLSICGTSVPLMIFEFHSTTSFLSDVTVFVVAQKKLVKWPFHLTICISSYVTVFVVPRVKIIKWDGYLKEDWTISISYFQIPFHLMIFTRGTTKTVTYEEIHIVKWNCHLTIPPRTTTKTVTIGRKHNVPWKSRIIGFTKLPLTVWPRDINWKLRSSTRRRYQGFEPCLKMVLKCSHNSYC